MKKEKGRGNINRRKETKISQRIKKRSFCSINKTKKEKTEKNEIKYEEKTATSITKNKIGLYSEIDLKYGQTKS